MNWIDLLLAAVVILAAWAGWRRGFILGISDLLVWSGSILLGYYLYPYTATLIDRFATLGAWLLPTAFLLTTAIARILTGILGRQVLKHVPEKISTASYNRLFGILPGVANGLIYATIISALFLAVPVKNSITGETRKSQIAATLSAQAVWANKKLAPVFDQAVRQTMNGTASHSESHELIELNFTCDEPRVRAYLESQMLNLINAERAKEGLKPLKADAELAVVARAHSKDMFAKGYFAHTNLDGKGPFDRMKAAHIKFRTAGENLALAQTLEIAHRNLMNSPGHRANIMKKDFGRVGIGVLDGGFYGLMISQEFRN